jgi:DNA-binding PadR family transcriptional regulator
MERKRRPSPQTKAVLLALAEQGSDWSHGYGLCSRLGLKAGTMYPILMRLAESGRVETAWEAEVPRGRPPRHLYRLSPVGAELVEELRAQRASMAGDAVPGVVPARRPAIGTAGA